jgi:hypothetical protein
VAAGVDASRRNPALHGVPAAARSASSRWPPTS